MDRTALAQLASHQLGEPVEQWIRARRAQRKVSLRDVVDDLQERTGIAVSPQTIANWLDRDARTSASSADPALADTG